MAYIWSYLRRYPKWLAMNFTAAILFVIANLGLPTVLARMIDEGINRGDVDKLYAYAWVMFGVVLTGIVGRILLSYAVGKLTTLWCKSCVMTFMLSFRSIPTTSMSRLGYPLW